MVLFVIAGVSALSFFELAGPLGERIAAFEGILMGWMRFLFPAALLVLGIILLRRPAALTALVYGGLVLLLLSSTGLLHFTVAKERALTEAGAGNGGGYLGYGVSWPLEQVTGVAAALILLLAVFLIGLLVTFNTSLQRLVSGGTLLRSLARTLLSIFRRSRTEPSTLEAEEHVTFSGRAVADVPIPTKDDAQKDEQRIPALSLPKLRKRAPRITTSIPLDLLSTSSTSPMSGDVKANSMVIKKALENFGIDVEMGEVNVGPTVTQYTLKPAEGVKLSQIVTLANDLALALAAHPIRIEAPIPGKSLVGVEVPNKATAIVTLREILDSDVFRRKKSNLTIALGKDVSGTPWTANLDVMPHLLIAGATGSGKSVCINTLLVSLLYQNSPDQLKLILVDPKRVELTMYNGIPHLITPVITDVKKTINALQWSVAEMDRRYRLLADAGARNIAGYNSIPDVEILPYLVIVIDELADLMHSSAREVEGAIVRLAQMARAVGIHLIVATQRPSVDVITGLIKANITSRIAFSVASVIDSRTILDNAGAEKLLGKGDLLYIAAELSKPKRLQGALVTETEIQRVVEHLRQQAEPEYEETVVSVQPSGTVSSGDDAGSEDELYEEAKAIVLSAGKASASMLQRRLRVGYARAARLLDILEEHGIIGPIDGARPRKVFGAAEREEDEPVNEPGFDSNIPEDFPSKEP